MASTSSATAYAVRPGTVVRWWLHIFPDLTMVLVLFVGLVGVRSLTLLLAFRCGIQVVLARLVVRLGGVVLARREWIGAAALVAGEVGSGDDAVAHPVLPGGQRIAAVAAESAGLAAADQVRGGQRDLNRRR